MAQLGDLIVTGSSRFINKINGACTDGTAGTTKYMRQDGTWAVPPNDNTTYTLDVNGNNVRLKNGAGTVISTVTAPYATSAGSATSATTASKLSNTAKIGDTNKPVYFTANGVPAAISYTIDKSVPSTAVFTDANVTVANTNPSSGTWYYPTWYTSTSGTGGLNTNNGFRHYSLEGTASAAGRTILSLGNGTETGTAGNKYGEIRIYSQKSGYSTIVYDSSATTNTTLTIPATTGTIINSGNYTTYTVKKDGTGATGSWGISVTGSSASCTGNAATATNVAWTGVTGKPTEFTPASGSSYYIKANYSASQSTSTAKCWVSMCNSSQTGSPTLPTSNAWWHVLSLDCWGSAPNNWVSQLALPEQGSNSIYYRHNGTGSSTVAIDSAPWVKVWDEKNLTNLNQLTNGPGYITGITKAMVTTALGYTPPTSDTNTTYTFATGSTNGAFSVTPSGGTAQSVSIKGLGSAAYTASTAYLASTTKYAASASVGGAASSLANFENNNSTAKNANDVTYNAHTYYTSNGPATSLGASTNDGALYCQAYSTSWIAQIAQDYRNGNLFTRGKNNGTWKSWRKVFYADDTYGGTLTKSQVTTALGYTPPTSDTNYYHTTGSWNGLTYTATANGGAGALAFTLPTGTSATTVAVGNHTHKYAGSSSAGGAATSANKLNTDAGSATNPVYFSGGVPVACSYNLSTSSVSGEIASGGNTTITRASLYALVFWGSGNDATMAYTGPANYLTYIRNTSSLTITLSSTTSMKLTNTKNTAQKYYVIFFG